MITIQELGNQLVIVMGGVRLIAYPSGPGVWIVSGDGGGIDPDPPVGDGAIWPFSLDHVSSEYRSAERPNHNGMDFSYWGIDGQPIPSALPGVVVERVVNFGPTSWGNYVVVETVIDGDVLRLLYAHMKTEPIVAVGDTVTRGQSLGPVGSTGNSTGPHLHWETRINGSYVNPRDFMAVYGE